MVSVILGLLMLAVLFVMVVIAAILIGLFFTGLIGGIVLLLTGNHFSKDVRKKVASRICIAVGVVFLVIAGSSAGLIVSFIAQVVN